MKFIFFTYTLCLICCCACTDKEIETDHEPVLNVLTISDAFIQESAWTKAALYDTLTTDSIGVFRLAANKYKAKSNVKFKYKDSWWVATGSDTLCLNRDTALICAYYPYGAAQITSTTDIKKVPIKTQKYNTKQDLCYQTTCKVNDYSPKVKLVMNRAYAKLTFVISHLEAYTGKCRIDSIAIIHSSIRKDAKLDLTTGKIVSATLASSGYSPQMTIASSRTDSTQMLMVPGATTEATNIFTAIFWLDKIQNSVQFAIPENKFEAGYNYRFPIVVSDKAYLMLQSISITDWEGSIMLPEINL